MRKTGTNPGITHEPVARIRHSVRFRCQYSVLNVFLPPLKDIAIGDFQWNMSQSDFCNRLEEVLDRRDGALSLISP